MPHGIVDCRGWAWRHVFASVCRCVYVGCSNRPRCSPVRRQAVTGTLPSDGVPIQGKPCTTVQLNASAGPAFGASFATKKLA
jgi:hypothetical protein